MNFLRELFKRAPLPLLPGACKWCDKHLFAGRIDNDWWVRDYCSTECGNKSISAEIEADKRLDDAMDAASERFEKM